MPQHEFRIGELVHDRDDPDSDDAVVVNTPPKTAEEWTAYTTEEGEPVTVAEDNPDYPAAADVIVVAFRNALDEALPEWPDRKDPYSLATLNDVGVRHYAFPAPRLTPADRSDDDEPAAETRPAEQAADNEAGPVLDGLALQDGPVVMHELAAHLDDANWQLEATDGVLTVTKLGETYRIHPDGTVEGEGDIREALEYTIAKFTG